jgi:hypothetical protein
MLEAKEFRRYAAEALQSCRTAETDDEKFAFLDLAKVWMRAAQRSEELFLRDSLFRVRIGRASVMRGTDAAGDNAPHQLSDPEFGVTVDQDSII